MKSHVNKNPSLLSLTHNIVVGLTLSLLISLEVVAATVTVSDNLIVRDVNDKPVEHGFLSKKQSFDLEQGKQSFVVKYKDVFENMDLGLETLVTTDYFVVEFIVKNQKNLALSTVAINDLSAAEAFSKSPELVLLDEKESPLVLKLMTLSDYELTKKVNEVVTTLSAAKPDNLSAQSQNKNVEIETKVLEQVDTLPMLKYWWLKASTKEKAEFLHYVEQNK